jgi:hypothetical protein
LSKLHTIESEISWANHQFGRQRSFKEKQESYDHSTETYVTKTYAPVSDIDWAPVVKTLKAKKRDLEKELDKNNVLTEVKFVLDSSIELY